MGKKILRILPSNILFVGITIILKLFIWGDILLDSHLEIRFEGSAHITVKLNLQQYI